MDRLTHDSLLNAIKEIESLKIIIDSNRFSMEEISEFVAEIAWNMSGIMKRRAYKSDEFQCRLRGLLHSAKRERLSVEKLELKDDEEFNDV